MRGCAPQTPPAGQRPPTRLAVIARKHVPPSSPPPFRFLATHAHVHTDPPTPAYPYPRFPVPSDGSPSLLYHPPFNPPPLVHAWREKKEEKKVPTMTPLSKVATDDTPLLRSLSPLVDPRLPYCCCCCCRRCCCWWWWCCWVLLPAPGRAGAPAPAEATRALRFEERHL